MIQHVIWVIGLVVLLNVFGRLDANANEYFQTTFHPKYLASIPVMHFFFGIYLSLIVVDVLSFKLKPIILLSVAVPLNVAILWIDPFYPWINHNYLPVTRYWELLIAALGFVFMAGIFEFRTKK